MNSLYNCKTIFEQTFKNQTDLIKYFRVFSELNNSTSINLNMNNVHFLNSKMSINNISNLNNHTTNMNISSLTNNNMSHSIDDSLSDMLKNINSLTISKIFNFCLLILLDINHLIEVMKTKNMNLLSEFFTIKQSLMFFRPVHLADERFMDDVIE